MLSMQFKHYWYYCAYGVNFALLQKISAVVIVPVAIDALVSYLPLESLSLDLCVN